MVGRRNGGHWGGERGKVARVPNRHYRRAEGRKLGLTSHLQNVQFIGDAEYLLSLGVVGNAEFTDEVDSNEVDIEVVANHELAWNLFLVLPLDRDRVDSVDPQVVVSGAFDARRMVPTLETCEMFVEGCTGQAGDCGSGVVEYLDLDPTHLQQDFVPIFSCWSHVLER